MRVRIVQNARHPSTYHIQTRRWWQFSWHHYSAGTKAEAIEIAHRLVNPEVIEVKKAQGAPHE